MCYFVSVMSELLSEIRQHMGCLYQLTDCVATLDMLVALAHNRTVSKYSNIRSFLPLITDSVTDMGVLVK